MNLGPYSGCFSDTALIWFEESDQPHPVTTTLNVIAACRYLLALGFLRNIPLRGAISYGRALICRQPMYFIGRPIAEAHALERRQNWAGVALCKSACESFADWLKHTFVTHWPVPVKTGSGVEDHHVIDWPGAILVRDGDRLDFAAIFPPSTEEKHDVIRRNTEAFYSSIPKGSGGPMFTRESAATMMDWRTIPTIDDDEVGPV